MALEIQDLSHGRWAVLANNCIDQAYRILEIYGVGKEVPNPETRVLIRISRDWCGSFDAEAQHL